MKEAWVKAGLFHVKGWKIIFGKEKEPRLPKSVVNLLNAKLKTLATNDSESKESGEKREAFLDFLLCQPTQVPSCDVTRCEHASLDLLESITTASEAKILSEIISETLALIDESEEVHFAKRKENGTSYD